MKEGEFHSLLDNHPENFVEQWMVEVPEYCVTNAPAVLGTRLKEQGSTSLRRFINVVIAATSIDPARVPGPNLFKDRDSGRRRRPNP